MPYVKFAGISACVSSLGALYSFNSSLQAKEMVDCHECRMRRLPKAHELPLYDKEEDTDLIFDSESKMPMESEISVVRKQLFGLKSYWDAYKDEAVRMFETGKAHSSGALDHLKDVDNKASRILAITGGGFTGLILARRGGIFKKVIYTSAGSGLVFSALYPSIAKEYFNKGFETTTSYGKTALEKYGGYDAKQIEENVIAKTETLKSYMKLDGLTKKLKEMFDKNNNKTNSDSQLEEEKPIKNAEKKD